MGARWRSVAICGILLLTLSNTGRCLESSISESMGDRDWCNKYANEVQWISEKTSVLITGRSNEAFQSCRLRFGLATSKSNARLRLNFDYIYIHDCGVQLQINESFTRDFSQSNKEMFLSKCNLKNPGPLYAQAKHFVLIALNKENIKMEAYNFRLNISMSEQLPSTGPDLHIVIIVGFVLVVVVGMAAFLLFKYVTKLYYDWHEHRVEEAMTRAINIYNSQEPLEEPDLVLMRPGDGTHYPVRSRPGGSEIAFVHSDGRIERFKPLDNSTRDKRESGKKLNNKKVDARQYSHEYKNSPCFIERDERSSSSQATGVDLNLASTRIRSYQDIDQADTASLGGCDMPPSYEEALEMPAPVGLRVNFPLQDSYAIQEEDKEGEVGAVGGCLELDYMNIGQDDTKVNVHSADSRKDIEDEPVGSDEALLPLPRRSLNKHL